MRTTPNPCYRARYTVKHASTKNRLTTDPAS